MAYTLTASSPTVNEGSSVVIRLFTSGLSDGTKVPYTILGSGISASDFLGATSLSGNFVVIGNQATLTLNVRADRQTEYDEPFTLVLTGTTFAENVTVVIKDTSRTSSNTFGQFYVTSAQSVVDEGETAIFNIRATNVEPGTAIAYSIFGIQSADLANPALISGIVVLNSSNVLNETTGVVTLSLLEDFVTEGPQTIVLVLSPDFPYSLELASTITVLDTSIDLTPKYFIDADKNSVIEGGNITFTLVAENVPEGTEVPWQIVGTAGSVTISDFSGITSLFGKWPALSSNTASFVLDTRDDLVFENTEVFYLTVPNTNSSSQLIRIIDSGNTLLKSDDIFTGNITVSFLDKADLKANLGSMTRGISFWSDTTGLLSENMVLEGKAPFSGADSLAYYHPFSYVIRSGISIQDWKNSIKSFLHPAGLTIFSEINNDTAPTELLSVTVKSTDDTFVNISDSITVDDTGFYASNTLLSGSNTFTVDSITLSINV